MIQKLIYGYHLILRNEGNMIIKFFPGSNRHKLKFEYEVHKAFGFLIEEYKCKCVSSDVTIVRYESDKIKINIYHGKGSYELGFQIALKNRKSEGEELFFSLKEIIDYYEGCDFKPFQTSTEAGVQKFVPIMAELVKKYALEGIKGDENFFINLSKNRTKWFTKYIIDMVRPEAEKAWKDKDYNRYIELMGEYENQLLPSEKKKIEFIRKRIR